MGWFKNVTKLPSLSPRPQGDPDSGGEEFLAEAEKITKVQTHPFLPGTYVGFYPAADVGVERSLGREPFPDPTVSSIVADDGTLEVAGLSRGTWCAAGQADGGQRYLYIQFPVT